MSETKITVAEHGPLIVEGEVTLCDADGNPVRTETRMALCRCGHSANKPFCDGAHRREGFIAEPFNAPQE
jgi:CDGSH-type Zn-finger protein